MTFCRGSAGAAHLLLGDIRLQQSVAGKQADAARASMLAVNEMTADAMLGTPDSDLWHNVDDLLHNVNDLMSRLDPEPSRAESAQTAHDEGDGAFFNDDAAHGSGPADEAPSTASMHQQSFENQVCHRLAAFQLQGLPPH